MSTINITDEMNATRTYANDLEAYVNGAAPSPDATAAAQAAIAIDVEAARALAEERGATFEWNPCRETDGTDIGWYESRFDAPGGEIIVQMESETSAWGVELYFEGQHTLSPEAVNSVALVILKAAGLATELNTLAPKALTA